MERAIGNWLLDEGPPIGHGSFAKVYKARHRETQKVAAVKAINTERLNKKLIESLAGEIAVLQRVRHPHIVSLIEVIKRPEKSRIFLVLEYCSGGDLSSFVKRNGRLGEDKVQDFMRQLCSGLKHLRSLNLMHRDLKPQNLLLSHEEDGKGTVLKIADFGFARDLSIHGLADTLCGSPLYMAPEILQYKQYDVKADLWSVGAILFELVSGVPPYTGNNHIQLLKCIEQKEAKLPPDLDLGVPCVHLIKCLLKKNPIQRLSFEGLFAHPFITGDTAAFAEDQSRLLAASGRGLSYAALQKQKERGKAEAEGLGARKRFTQGAEKGGQDPAQPSGSLEKEYVLIESPGLAQGSTSSSSSQQQPPAVTHQTKMSSSTVKARGMSLGSTDMFRQYAVKSTLRGSGPDSGPNTPKSNFNLPIHRPESTVERILLLEKCATIIDAQAGNQEVSSNSFALYLFGARLLETCCRMIQSEMSSATSSGAGGGGEAPQGGEGAENINFADFQKTTLSKMEDQLVKAQTLAETRLIPTDSSHNNTIPDPLDLIYSEALAMARKGAVEEIMGNYGGGAESYFCALNLLFFICTEAKEIQFDPPISLDQAEQARVYNYILNIQERYSACASQVQKESPGQPKD